MYNSLIENFQLFLDHSLRQNSFYRKKAAQFIFPLEESLIKKASNNIYFTNEQQFIWKKPFEDIYLHSIGRIDFQKVFGYNQLFLSKEIFEEFKAGFVSNEDPSFFKKIPLFVGNNEFIPFSDTSVWNDFFNINWFIPKLLLILDKGKSLLVYCFSLKNEKKIILNEFEGYLSLIFNETKENETEKPIISNKRSIHPGAWQRLVDNALCEIGKGSFSKVVLSRKTEFDFKGNLDLSALRDVSARYPSCVSFLHKKGDSLFFGVTPERLLKISEGFVETEALAGSIKRGKKEDEDLFLSERLLRSNKNLTEQQYVTDYITSKLANFTTDIIFNADPEIVKLENIQHLRTNITAQLKKDKFFFDLVNALHPTPAVCGYPKEAAYNFILSNEGYERGLYSGITGWFNLYEEGEFAVAIRSALIKGNKLIAFSGCGIVEGSDALAEYEETEIKLKPILSIFGYEN